MVSSVLAQAILGQRPIDFVGQFEQGRADKRAVQSRELSSELLQGQFKGGKIGELAGVDPTAALQLANALNIPTNDRARLEAFAKDTQIAFGRASAGDINGAVQFVRNRRDARRAQGVDTTNMDDFLARAEQNPDSVLSNLKALNAGFEQAGVIKPIGGGTKFQFGAQQTFKDEDDNLFFGTTKRSPTGGTVTSALTPIGNAPATPVGDVSLASGLGETAAQKTTREIAQKRSLADVEVSKAGRIETVKQRVKRGSEIRKELSTRNREAARSGRNLQQALKLASRATQGLTGGIKLQLGRLLPGVDTTDEAALGASLDQLALDQLQAFKGPTTDFEFGVTRNIAGRVSDPRAANVARIKSLARSSWFNQREFDQFDKHVKSGGDPDTFRFNFGEPVKTKRGVFTLQDLQDTAIENNFTIEETIAELNK